MMQLNIHDSTLKRVGSINNDLPEALHYFNDNWHRYLTEGTSTFDFSVNKVNPTYALLTLQSYISFSYDDEDYLFNIINIQQDHSSMTIQCENLNFELISEEVEAYSNTKRHSIVWYLKNAAKITDNVVEIGNNPFSLVDEDNSNPILTFDSTETKLARIISICDSFKAEFQFKTKLKNDGTLYNITIDLYEAGGVGQKRKDVTLFYGKNVDGITSTGDRTSTFFNSTTVTDSNGKFNWKAVEGKYYNSDGQLEFYKDAGSNVAYAPLSRDMFPSQIKSANSDQFTNKNLQTAATSNDSLWDYAVSQFKLYAYPQMTYEVVVAVNAVTNALGNDRKLDIGDTIIVQDKTFDKSEGGLILSARVSEQEISFTNPANNKITFSNFVRLKSQISADLLSRMKDIVNENTPYRAELETTNGVQFKNSAGSTTLTARIYFGSDSTETKADSYSWTKDGILVTNVQEITVDASEIDGKAVYAYKATVNEKVVGTASVTITNVNDGAQGPQGPQGLKGDPGATGIPGQAGADGKTSYLHIAYATNSTGTAGFDVSNATGKTYIGQYTDFTSADSTDPSKYTWSLIKGDKGDKGDTGPQGPQGERGIAGATGTTGSPGPKGADGRSSYIHIKYAPVINPTDSQITDTPNAYIGVYTDYNQSDSTSASAYTWSKWQGEDGANGVAGAKGADGRTTYVHFAYANSTNGQTNFSTSYFDGALYMGTLTDYTQTDSTNYAAYTWSRLKGDKGDKGDQGVQGIQGLQGPAGTQGVAGPKGADGKTQYTHIAYANSADGKTDFSTSDSNRAYIGMYVDFNINDSTTPSDYSWTLVKGADGTQGTPGKPGTDGKTPYFHTAWSYSADGTDGFTTVYPNLNLFTGTSDKPSTSTGGSWNIATIGVYKTPKVGQEYTLSVEVPETDHDVLMEVHGWNNAGRRVGWSLFSTVIKSGGKAHITFTWPDPKDSGVTQLAANLAWTNGGDTGTYSYCKSKLEIGNTATPYMQSSSEAKTSDWPSYIGQYTDFTQADSTNPSDYTWSLIRGNDGKDGADGKDGIAGKDGVGIKTTVITYAISTSGTTAPTTGWTAQVPTLIKGQCLWTQTTWVYTDNTTETGYTVSYNAKDGNNGSNGIAGKDGVGIKTTVITYASHTNGITAPTTGYTTTVPSVPAGQFLWTKTVWTYTDNSSETGYSVAMMGLKGDKGDPGNNGTNGIAGKDGKGIKATAITYQASTNGTTAPTGTWSASVPTVAKGSFLWTRTIWTYTDNATETGYAVAYMGTNGNNGNDGIAGKDGVGIKTTTITYAGSTSGTTVPTSGWTSTVPTVAAGSYLWTKTVWAYTDNTIETGYSVGKMGNTGPAGPAGSNGNPGKVVSDTEPTTKFKGLTWKYSGVVDMTLGDGTKILAGTEYYWNGTVWALYEINAHNINGDNLSVTNGTFKDGKIESIWGENGVKGTTTIEGSHLQIYSSNSTTNTENTVALDNLQGYAQVYTDRNTGRAITVQASFQGFFVSDSTGPFVRVTPNGISTSSDKSYNSLQIGAGITINLERRGDMVEATLSGFINSSLSSNTTFTIGTIPVGYRPNRTAYIMVHMTSSVNSSHIDVEPNGVCTWWGTSTNTGAPRGAQMWFTSDSLPK
ncbi:serine/threonine protein phosphatase [Lactococcus cremoris]|uniref:Hypothetical serine/threonine-rich protein P11E10.02c in chromosome I n=2 Tax=Lactococcus lactis subsp. cremoris TaxID=1359 RepID=A2RMW7_LACLM|nr:serine/threonine protein phosphatase [Lactococcus cremoris]ADJ61055.1 serine/threonine-rich protein precursor [Lactococcus cremoris subsp. cremoris NZ9000]MCT4445920.1 serine/threonine protein phosphatase [Lactococcus cremoris]MCZ7688548.1 serine/threonine protein phosphatase [Lactococcus cremoris]MCZ7690639.1 serine/threonine protein phosphatase [Lactococcus cremoris]MRM07918.1 serine/threonine protein phosphatase [Lactococcus cremoris subsp. cremoris MG1363]